MTNKILFIWSAIGFALSAMTLGACGQDTPLAHVIDPASDMVRVPKEVLEASRTRLSPYASGPTVLFLNFDGVTINQSNSSDASQNSSFIGAGTIPPFNGDQSTKDQVVSLTKQLFAAYNVQIVTTRPSSGDYDMAVVGGSPENIGMGGGGIVGVAPMDCNDEMPRDIAFAFAGTIQNYGGNYVQEVAETIAHECGHTYGLPHSNDGCDLMSYDTCAQLKTFLDKQMGMQSDSMGECGMSSMNSHQVLLTTLGPSTGSPTPEPTPTPTPNPGDTTPPVVQIINPANGAQIGQNVTISANITDDTGVMKAELDVDGLVVSSRTAMPYDFTVTLTPGQHNLTVKAYDAINNPGMATITVTVDPGQANPNPNPNPTPAPAQGEFGAACTGSEDCLSGLCAEDTSLGGKYCTQACNPQQNLCPNNASCLAAGQQFVCSNPGGGSRLPATGSDDGLVGGCTMMMGTTSPPASPLLGFALVSMIFMLFRRKMRT